MSTTSSPQTSSFFYRVCEFVAKGFGAGYMPKAPGTWGTALGLPIAYFLLNKFSEPWMHIILATFVVLLAYVSIHFYEKGSGHHDDQQVVVDEIAGIFLTFLFLPLNMPILLAGFILFRALDILKPGPIGWADQKLPGAFGTLLDDLFAGGFCCVLLHFVVYLERL